MPDGAVVVRDTRSRWTAFVITAEADLIAHAVPCKADAVVNLSIGFIRALRNACAGLWCDPAFMPAPGDTRHLPLRRRVGGIPFGLEYVVSMMELPWDDPDLHQALAQAAELSRLIPALDADRRDMFEQTFGYALQWVLAHELGHSTCGHLEELQRSMKDIEMRLDGVSGAGIAEASPDQPHYQALEAQADGYASDLIFSKARPGRQLTVAVLGSMVALSLFEVQNVVDRCESWSAVHPPVWYRAHEAIRTSENRQAPGAALLTCHVLACYIEAQPHCAQWLATAMGGALDGALGAVNARLAEGIAPRSARLEGRRATLLSDPDGLSVDAMRPGAG